VRDHAFHFVEVDLPRAFLTGNIPSEVLLDDGGCCVLQLPNFPQLESSSPPPLQLKYGRSHLINYNKDDSTPSVLAEPPLQFHRC